VFINIPMNGLQSSDFRHNLTHDESRGLLNLPILVERQALS